MNFFMLVVVPLKSNFGFFTAALPRAAFKKATCWFSWPLTTFANLPTLPAKRPLLTASA